MAHTYVPLPFPAFPTSLLPPTHPLNPARNTNAFAAPPCVVPVNTQTEAFPHPPQCHRMGRIAHTKALRPSPYYISPRVFSFSPARSPVLLKAGAQIHAHTSPTHTHTHPYKSHVHPHIHTPTHANAARAEQAELPWAATTTTGATTAGIPDLAVAHTPSITPPSTYLHTHSLRRAHTHTRPHACMHAHAARAEQAQLTWAAAAAATGATAGIPDLAVAHVRGGGGPENTAPTRQRQGG